MLRDPTFISTPMPRSQSLLGSQKINPSLQSTFVGFTKDQTPLKHPLRYKNTMVLVSIGLLVLIEANVKGSNLYIYTLASSQPLLGSQKIKHPLSTL